MYWVDIVDMGSLSNKGSIGQSNDRVMMCECCEVRLICSLKDEVGLLQT